MPFKYCAEIQIMKHFHLSFLKRSRLLQQLVGSLHIHGQVAISVLLFLLPHNRVMFGKKKSYIYDKRFYQNTLRWNEAAVLQQNVKQFWLARCKKRLHNSAFSIDDRKNGFYWSWNCHNLFVYFGKFLGVNA